MSPRLRYGRISIGNSCRIDTLFAGSVHPEAMNTTRGFPRLTQALACWNWKCALLSAAVRSAVYLAAMAHGGPHSRSAVAAVEMGYVALTAGLWAGMQQKALGLRSRWLGNVVVAVVVPSLSQLMDWLVHRAAGATAPPRATVVVCVFTALSALFHLHAMRRGAFLTGHGCSLADDFRQVPRLLAGFVLRPAAMVSAPAFRLARTVESRVA